jgi:CTP synthase (UTP-ammonia lyase)
LHEFRFVRFVSIRFFFLFPFSFNLQKDNKHKTLKHFLFTQTMETKARLSTCTAADVKQKVTRIKPTLQKKPRSESTFVPRRSKYQWGTEQARQWATRKEQQQRPEPQTNKEEQAEELQTRMARITKAKEANDAWKAVLESLSHSQGQATYKYKAELRCRGATEVKS